MGSNYGYSTYIPTYNYPRTSKYDRISVLELRTRGSEFRDVGVQGSGFRGSTL